MTFLDARGGRLVGERTVRLLGLLGSGPGHCWPNADAN